MIKKFKKLTIESKVFYVFMVFIIFWFMVVILSSCSHSIYRVNKPIITHVLALTDQGDTLKIPIESISPNVVYNVVGYDYMRYNPYYSPYNNRYYYDYSPNNAWRWNSYGRPTYSQGWHPLENFTTAPPTPVQIPISGGNNYSGTSGFSGNPVASNPVTNGGMKTKN